MHTTHYKKSERMKSSLLKLFIAVLFAYFIFWLICIVIIFRTPFSSDFKVSKTENNVINVSAFHLILESHGKIDENNLQEKTPPKENVTILVAGGSFFSKLHKAQLERKRQKAIELAEALQHNYIAKMRLLIQDKTETKIGLVTATCRFPKLDCYDDILILWNQDGAGSNNTKNCVHHEHRCFGFGDRLRGTVIAFYLAVSTRRLFHLDWVRPSDLADYFNVNHHIYNVSEQDYHAKIAENAEPSRWLLHRMDLADLPFIWELANSEFNAKYEKISNLRCMSNLFAGLEGIFSNKAFIKVLNETMPTVFADDQGRIDDFIPVISAALRTIIGRPNEKLAKLVDKIIDKAIGETFWHGAKKIGVQIRTQENEPEHGERVMASDAKCFASEVERLIRNVIRAKKVAIFVTTDSPRVWQFLSDFFTKQVDENFEVKFFQTDEKFNLTMVHVDYFDASGSIKKNDEATWFAAAKTFVDWHLLTKMDYLVISRSGFSESAAHLTLAPTRRFMHWETNSNCTFQDYQTKPMSTVRGVNGVPLVDIV